MSKNYNDGFFKSKEEDDKYDRKSVRIDGKEIAKTVVAFANAEGGIIAVGIEDDKTITGIDGDVKKVNDIKLACSKYCNPPILCEFTEMEVIDDFGKENHVLIIAVPKSSKVHENQLGDAYRRIGDKSVKMTFQERLNLHYARGEENFELMPVKGSSIDNLDLALVDEYIKKIGYPFSCFDFLNENGYIVGEKGEASTKAILLFGKNPQYYFDKARIRFIRFDGVSELTGANINVVKDCFFDGTLIIQLKNAIDFVKTQIREKQELDVKGIFNTKAEYPEFCWMELIVNAVIHRDYSIEGTEIQVKMFDDRFAVESPGCFPKLITEKNIKNNHFSRNKGIAEYMRNYNYVKEFGEGVRRVYSDMHSAGLPDPTFKNRDFMTIATLINEYGAKEKENHELIVQVIQYKKNNPDASVKELASQFNKTQRSIQMILNRYMK